MQQLLACGIESKSISIETLDYPFEWVATILNELKLSVCIDLGHLMVHGFEPETVFDRYSPITSIIHLHGVENHKDHLALDRLSSKRANIIMGILKRFTGVVSLEVFAFDRLVSSLSFLEQRWQD
jgi:sugar phosphate isomerase/epimerase